MEKERENNKQAEKRKRENENEVIKSKKARDDLSVIKEKILEEELKLQAAKRMLENGREKLNAALLQPKIEKVKMIEANDLIQFGTDKINRIEIVIASLIVDRDKLKLLNKL